MAFSHLDPGAPAADWDELVAALPKLAPPPADQPLVVVAAHPDDESLGAGGLIATARGPVRVIIASDGDASHPDSPTHTPQDLARRRRDEIRAAVRMLAPHAEVHLLGCPDGHLADHVSAIAAAIDEFAAPGALLVTPWWGDGHPDHAACAHAGAASAAGRSGPIWQYPIWAWQYGDRLPDEAGALGALHLAPAARAAKQAALACHVSQHEPLSPAPGDEAILSAAMLAHFARNVEVFVTHSAAQAGYFAGLYADDLDPWQLAGRYYEQRKRAVLLAALPRARFRRAFEPGCATGLLTAQLAARCDEVLARDVDPTAVAAARTRVGDQTHVHVATGAIPGDWPSGPLDLVVLSEVGYYCPDLDELTRRLDETLAADGVLVACHWRHPAPLHPHGADAVHAALGRGRRRIVEHTEADFRLDVWTVDGRSVAQCEGIVA